MQPCTSYFDMHPPITASMHLWGSSIIPLRQVVSMIHLSILYPVVDTAARLGEAVVAARTKQLAFERRAVHKYAFAIARVGDVEDGGEGNRGLSWLPSIGQLVAVRESDTLVCHQEKLSISYLRRSFLRIGRGAWGTVRA